MWCALQRNSYSIQNHFWFSNCFLFGLRNIHYIQLQYKLVRHWLILIMIDTFNRVDYLYGLINQCTIRYDNLSRWQHQQLFTYTIKNHKMAQFFILSIDWSCLSIFFFFRYHLVVAHKHRQTMKTSEKYLNIFSRIDPFLTGARERIFTKIKNWHWPEV